MITYQNRQLVGSNTIASDYPKINLNSDEIKTDLESLQGQVNNLTVGASNDSIGVYSIIGSGTNAITGSFVGIASYYAGLKINLTIENNNTGAVTLNINGLGASSVKMYDYLGNKINLVNDDFVKNTIYQLTFDGIDFIVINKEIQKGNKNLLVNSNFKVSEIVNQRGESTYNSTGYTIDMWFARLPNATDVLDRSEEYLKLTQSLTGGNNFVYIVQQFENKTEFKNKTVTFTVKVKGTAGNIIRLYRTENGIQKSPSQFTLTGNEDIFSTTFTNIDTSLDSIKIDTGNIAQTIYLYFAKLEFGGIATKFEDDDPAIKLIKCQRYLYRKSFFTLGIMRNTTLCLSQLLFNMYKSPILLNTYNSTIYTNKVISSVNNAISSVNKDRAYFQTIIDSADSIPIGTTVEVNAEVLLSAEL